MEVCSFVFQGSLKDGVENHVRRALATLRRAVTKFSR
jgi:hypothetical protein